jgi:methylated-DNA-[protein]-cysteine S-methyltransferase
MSATGFALFDTPIGRCGLAWSASGVAGVQLPEASEAATRARLRKRFPGAVEAEPKRGAPRGHCDRGAPRREGQ